MYNGGKNGPGVYQTIINNIPPHKIYIETYLGSGAIMKHKKPAEINIGIEIDPKVINDFHTGAAYKVINACSISCLNLLSATAGKETFIYADPPYPKSSRRSAKDIYNFEMQDADHVKLLSALLATRANVAISTYKNDLYSDMLKGWRLITFRSRTRAGMATEYLYMNYEKPDELHDYSFLGKDNTERQRIQRKIIRHVERLKILPQYERNAIIEAIGTIQLKTSLAAGIDKNNFMAHGDINNYTTRLERQK